MLEFFTSGETADRIGKKRDALLFALRHYGAPDAKRRFAGKRMFTEEEVEQLRLWFEERGNRRKSNTEAVGA